MANIKFYFDLLSQPSRALWLALKISKTPIEFCPVALRKRKFNLHLQQLLPLCPETGKFKVQSSCSRRAVDR